MRKIRNEEAYQQTVKLLEEQLQVLPISIAMLFQPTTGTAGSDLAANAMRLKRKYRPHKTGSCGNIVANEVPAEAALDFHASNRLLRENPAQKIHCLRVVIGNALLAVALYLKEHDMASLRTPEIQFLEHVYDAILNSNRFKIEPGYIPMATFDGLVIDSKLNGALLFGDGVNEGFMEFGDAIALLQWLLRYLRGEKTFVSDGDAG